MKALALLLLSGLVTAPLAAQTWCDRPPRAGYETLTRVPVADPWFHVYRVDEGTFALYEPDNFQEVISWLIVGSSRALLFDTGMGMSRISAVVRELTPLPVTVVNSHSHYDHVGGNAEFDDVRSPALDYTRGHAAGLPHTELTQEVAPDALCTRRLRAGFDTAAYVIRPFRAAGTVQDGTTFDLGGRRLEVLAVPGHAPDALALLDRGRGQLWTGDSFYPGPIWLHFPGTDLDAYEASMARLAALAPSLRHVFPGHNLPVADPAVLPRVLDRFRAVRAGQVRGTPQAGGLVDYPAEGFSFLMRAPGPPLRVLFIGNSYTYFNDLPSLVADLGHTARYERPIRVDMVVAPGATLEDHWRSGDALAAIRREPWDLVVLQEQSMLGVLLVEGAPAVNDPTLFHAVARRFIGEIRSAGASPMLFLTWARQSTPAAQDRITRAYAALARETGARLAPVGEAWRLVRMRHPNLALHAPDGTHPSPLGSYLAAATIWSAIDGTPARGLPAEVRGRPLRDSLRIRWADGRIPVASLSDSVAALLQMAADSAMAAMPSLPTVPDTTPRLPALPVGTPLAWRQLAGRWKGTMRLFDAPVDIELLITTTGAAPALTWRVIGSGWESRQGLSGATLVGDTLAFTISDPRFLAPDERHHAVLSGGDLVGRVEVGSATRVPRLLGSWRLRRAPD